ncbi:VOC family protein [Salinigranum sp. GCM10025319]|uniref:VOC family protein n=1 Tax=Salinigranum sp. GCM10025319 TaxID=3252687 RepID=UPI003615F8B1
MTPDTGFTMPASARLGQIALRVGSIDRLVPFYRDVVGLAVDRDGTTARLSAGGDPLVVLDEAIDAPTRPTDAAGLFHLAVRVPTRAALGDALARVDDAEVSLSGASDHLVSEALYLRDPEGNGVEIYRDRPREAWTFTDDGRVEMDTLPLDLDDVAAAAAGNDRAPSGTDLGHVHLEATALDRARSFYVDALGLNVRSEDYRDALFVAAGDYHHHVGLNTWNRRLSPAGGSRGVEWFEFRLPDRTTLSDLRDRLDATRSDAVVDPDDYDGFAVTDPDGIGVRFAVDS